MKYYESCTANKTNKSCYKSSEETAHGKAIKRNSISGQVCNCPWFFVVGITKFHYLGWFGSRIVGSNQFCFTPTYAILKKNSLSNE